jgi:membrane fusion protein (multidrug efflux system)
MKQKVKQVLSYVIGLLILVLGIVGARYLSSQKQAPPRQAKEVTTRQVRVQLVKNEDVPAVVQLEGRLIAYDKVEIFSEVGGQVLATNQPFKVGVTFAKGMPMIKMDDEEARLSLLALKSTLLNSIAQLMPDLKVDYPASFPQWDRYLADFDIQKPVMALPQPLTPQEKRFVAARNLYTQYYNVKSAEERLSKYTLYAPFNGVLTESTVSAGTLVRVGQKLGSIMKTADYELIATVPLTDLRYVRPGTNLRLSSEDVEGGWNGRVSRISDVIDAGSQTVQVFVSVSGTNLREGMYLRGQLSAASVANAFRINKNLLVNQQGVYVVQDSTLRFTEVELVKIERESAIIRGLSDGTRILSEMPPAAFDGMKVSVQPLQ